MQIKNNNVGLIQANTATYMINDQPPGNV